MVIPKSQVNQFVFDVCKGIQEARAALMAEGTPIPTGKVSVSFQAQVIDDTQAPIAVQRTENNQPEQTTVQTREAAEQVQTSEGYVATSEQVQDGHEDRTEQAYGRSSETNVTFVE